MTDAVTLMQVIAKAAVEAAKALIVAVNEECTRQAMATGHLHKAADVQLEC